MDCFASLAMTLRYSQVFPRHKSRPSFASHCPSKNQRAQGRPDAGCTRGPVCNKKAHELGTTGSTGATRPSLRNGLRLMARSPRSTGLDSLRRLSLIVTDLIPASGDQDHALLPSAADIIRRTDVAASITSRPAFVTTRNAPLAEAGWRHNNIYF